MMQAMKLQYDEATQPTYQYYGLQGCYRGNNVYRGRGGSGSQHQVNWQEVRGRRASSDLTHYC